MMNKTVAIMCICFTLLIAMGVNALDYTVIFQPNDTNATDTYVAHGGGLNNNNYGTDIELTFGKSDTGIVYRTLFNWSYTCDSIPTLGINYSINSVNLSLYIYAAQGTSQGISMYQLNKTYNEATASSETCDGSTYLCNASFNRTHDLIINKSRMVDVDNVGWINLTINKTWYSNLCNGSTNKYGTILLGNETASNNHKTAVSSSYTTPNLRPKLIVTYQRNPATIDNCTTNSIKTLNIRFLNLSDSTKINASMDIYFSYGDTIDSNTYNYSISVDSTSNYTFCISEYPETYADIHISYEVEGIYYSQWLDNYYLSDTTQTLNLYASEASTDTSIVLFTVSDENDNPVEGAYIYVNLYNIGTNSYQTTEILKTDNNGEALGNIILNTQWYQFKVIYGGEIKLTEPNKKITDTSISLRIALVAEEEFIAGEIQDLEIEVMANDEMYSFDVNWTEISNILSSIIFYVNKVNATTDILIYGYNSTNTSGYLTYNLPAPYTTTYGTYVGNVYGVRISDGVTYYIKGATLTIREEYDLFGDESLFISFIFIGTMSMIGVAVSAVASILLTIFGMIIFFALGFYKIALSGLISIIVGLLLIMFKVKNR